MRFCPSGKGQGRGKSTAAHIEEGGGMDGPDAFLGRLERNQERWMGPEGAAHVKWGAGSSFVDVDSMTM